MTPLEILSPQTFLHVWRTEFPQLKIPCHNTLGVCNMCSLLKKTFTSLERQNLQTAFKAHLVQVRNERHAQIEKNQGAASFSRDSWMIATNFMQELFQPYLCHCPKS
jgi:hypothetical protein